MSGAAFAPWQQQAYARVCDAIDHDHLAHGLLIRGPALLGKRALAQRLAKRLLCDAVTADGQPCDACRSCRLFEAGTHPDYAFVSFIPTRDGARMRTEIVIEQVRELSERLALTPQYGGAQVVVIDPADALNHAAANALLKTLEEPQPGRFLWLLSAHPARLPATIRSRCQVLELRLPPQAEALAWLRARGHADGAARHALDAARGHPGQADAWLTDGSLALREAVAGDLAALAKGRAAATEVAQRWCGDDQAGLRLRFAADIAAQRAAGLTDPATTRRLATWFDQINRCRDLLRTTVRADLAVTEALLAWRGPAAGASRESSQR